MEKYSLLRKDWKKVNKRVSSHPCPAFSPTIPPCLFLDLFLFITSLKSAWRTHHCLFHTKNKCIFSGSHSSQLKLALASFTKQFSLHSVSVFQPPGIPLLYWLGFTIPFINLLLLVLRKA